MDHADVIRREFARQASSFSEPRSFFGDAEIAAWIDSLLPLTGAERVLDVCGGAGHLSRALTDRARSFTVLDLTPELLELGRASGVANVEFVLGDATEMPFADGTFDLAVSRFAFHHLPDPVAVASEMARVVRPSGHLAVIDMVGGGARHDELERLRDPSHTRALAEEELRTVLGGELVARDMRSQTLPAEPWLVRGNASERDAQTVLGALAVEADGGEPTGLRAHYADDGSLRIAQDWLLLVTRSA